MRGARDERGQVTILVVLMLTVLCVFGALVIDIGNARQTGVSLQSAADAAASAGASQLPASAANARIYAADYAFDSLLQPRNATTTTCPSDAPVPGTTVCYQSSGGAIVYVTTPYTASPGPANGTSPVAADQINVMICLSVNTTLARVINVTTLRPCKSSTGDVTFAAGGLPCAICVINPTAKDALDLDGGTATINVSGGAGVAVDSNNAEAVLLGDSKCHGSAALNVTGGGTIQINGVQPTYKLCGGSTTPSPAPIQGSVPDPFASIQTPADLGLTTGLSAQAAVNLGSNGVATISPGIYPSITLTNNAMLTMNPGNYEITGSITLSGAATLTMGAGVYVIEGGLLPNSGTTITGTGVTLYFTCSGYPTQTSDSSCPSGGGTGGYFSQTGGGGTILSGPTSGTYQGLVMFYDRNDTGNYTGSGCTTPFASNGSTTGLQVTGTIYAASAQLCMSGGAMDFNSLFDVNELELSNSATINDNAVASNQVPFTGAQTTALIG